MMGAALQSPGAMSRDLAAALARCERLEAENASLKREMGAILVTERLLALQRHYRLTGREAALVLHLYESRNRVVTKDGLLDVMYGQDADCPVTKIIDVFVCKIRAKARAKGDERFIETVWGVGYRLTPTGAARCAHLFGLGKR